MQLSVHGRQTASLFLSVAISSSESTRHQELAQRLSLLSHTHSSRCHIHLVLCDLCHEVSPSREQMGSQWSHCPHYFSTIHLRFLVCCKYNSVLFLFTLFHELFNLKFSCKYHYRVFREWQNKNQIVTLKLNSHKTKLPPSNEFINPIQDMSIHVVENNHFELSTRNNNNNVACSNDNTSGAAPNCSVIQLETNMNQVSVDDETSISFEQQVIHGHSKLQRQSTAASSDNSIC